MKRFEFKLQAVLTLRLQAEQTALTKYCRAIQSRQAAADRLVAVDQELMAARHQWLQAMTGGCPAVQAAQIHAYSQSVEERRRQREQELHLADVELNQASHRMLLARQQREAVERYLERQREEYERLLRLEERKLIDDLVGRRPPISMSGRNAGDHAWN